MDTPLTPLGREAELRDEVSRLRDDLAQLRKELIVTRIGFFGLVVVVGLMHYGARRLVVGGVGLALLLVMTFLGCQWGIGDLEMSLGQSIGVTLTLAAVLGFLLLWSGIP